MTNISKLKRKEYRVSKITAFRFALCLLLLAFSGLFVRAVRAEVVTLSISTSVSTTGVSVKEGYTLRMTAVDSFCPMPEGKTGGSCDLVLKGAGSGKFSGLSFTEPGVYNYKIIQLPGNHEYALSYDTTVYDLRVQASESNGKLVITAVMYREGSNKKAPDANFLNRYINPAIAQNPPVKKTVTGDTPSSPESFSFTFTPVSNTAGLAEMPMPEGSSGGRKTVSTTPGTEVEFGEMKFEAPGEYVYEIAEVNDGKKGYTYDKSVYKLTYTVERKSRELTSSLTVTKDGKPAEKAAFSFTNEYKGDKKPKPDDDDDDDDDDDGKDDKHGGSRTHRGSSSSSSSGGSGSSSGGSSRTRTEEGAETGDRTPILFWSIVLAAAALGIGVTLFWRHRSKQ